MRNFQPFIQILAGVTFPAKSLGKNEKQGSRWGWVSCWAGAAFSAIYVSIYLGVAFPALNAFQIPIEVGTVVLCSVLNMFSIAVTGKANTIVTGLLAITMLAFVGVGLFGGQWEASMLTPFFTQGTGGGSGFLSAIPAYGSIVAVAFMVGEIKDPNKTVPKAMSTAMAVVVCLYVLVMVTTLGLVTSAFLQENPGMVFISLYAAAFTKLAVFPWVTPLISVSAVLALITTILVLVMLSARTIQAAAIGGILPKALAKKTKQPIPQ